MPHSAAPALLHMAHRLKPEQAAFAFALAQQAYPALTRDQWSKFIDMSCAETEEDGPVIFGVENLRGYFMGICIGRVCEMPQHGRIFDVDPFIVFDLGDSGTLSRSLFLTLEHHARNLGCEAIRLATPTRVPPPAEPLPHTGHNKDRALLDRLVGSEQVTRSIYTLAPIPATR
ncbi:MAG TPA: hypothetical protein VM659_10140 [Dongiaceae bacterium]|nr:hypothetical protein [Dongiaceae bacterium]